MTFDKTKVDMKMKSDEKILIGFNNSIANICHRDLLNILIKYVNYYLKNMLFVDCDIRESSK